MNRNVLLAVVVFAVLLGAVLLTRGRGEKVGIRELKLPALVAADVTKIEVTGKNKALLERDGDKWTVADPADPSKKLAVEESAIKAVTDAFVDMSTSDFVSERKEKHKELEIDDETGLHVKVSAKSGDGYDLVFGKAAKGGGTYVRKASGDDVFVTKGRLGSVLRKDVAGWRKRQIVDVKADDIARIDVKPVDGTAYAVVAEREAPKAAEGPDAGPPPAPKTTWKLAEGTTLPPGFRLDADGLARIAQSFASLRASDFAEGDAAKDETTGLAAPHSVVEVTTTGGKKLALHLGKEDDKKRVYAKTDGDAQVYLIGSYQAKQVAKPLDDLRDVTLFSSFTADDVQKISIKSGATKVVVARDANNTFALVEPKAPPAGYEFDPGSAQGQAAQLARLRAARLVGEKVTGDMGLSSGEPVIEVTTKDGKSHVARFGKAVPEPPPPPPATDGGVATPPKPAPPKEFYVQGDADAFAYAIARFPKERYEKPLDLFKKVERPPMGAGGGPGGISGLENLPPDVRKKLEESLKKGPPPGGP